MGGGESKPKLTPKEEAKQNKRTVDKAARHIEREQTKLTNQEKKCLDDIKKLAAKNQHGPAKIMAKNLVRMRQQVNSMYQMKAQLQAISMQLSTVQITATMMESMQGVNKVMGKINEQMDVKSINTMIREFSKNSEKFGLQQEMVSNFLLNSFAQLHFFSLLTVATNDEYLQMQDAMDMAFDNPETDADADGVYNQILEEQGLGALNQGDMAVGTGGIKQGQAQAQDKLKDAEVDDLQKRLDNLM